MKHIKSFKTTAEYETVKDSLPHPLYGFITEGSKFVKNDAVEVVKAVKENKDANDIADTILGVTKND